MKITPQDLKEEPGLLVFAFLYLVEKDAEPFKELTTIGPYAVDLKN